MYKTKEEFAFSVEPKIKKIEDICTRYLKIKLEEKSTFLEEISSKLDKEMHSFNLSFNLKMVEYAPQLICKYIEIYQNEINRLSENIDKSIINNDKNALIERKTKITSHLNKLINTALHSDGLQIGCIYQPTEQQKLIAIRSNYNTIALIDNPTDDMIALAAKSQPGILEQYPNRSEQCYIKAITYNHKSIFFIPNPTYEMENIAIRNGLDKSQYDNPSLYLIIDMTNNLFFTNTRTYSKWMSSLKQNKDKFEEFTLIHLIRTIYNYFDVRYCDPSSMNTSGQFRCAKMYLIWKKLLAVQNRIFFGESTASIEEKINLHNKLIQKIINTPTNNSVEDRGDSYPVDSFISSGEKYIIDGKVPNGVIIAYEDEIDKDLNTIVNQINHMISWGNMK